MSIIDLFKTWTKEEAIQAMRDMPLYRKLELKDALIAAGYTPSDLIAAGWTPSALIAAGWNPSDLIAAGWNPSDLRDAGWTPSDLIAAGWTPSALIAAGWNPSDLIAAGWTLSDLIAAGWTPSALEDYEAQAKKDIQEKAKKMGKAESEYVVYCLKKGLLKGDSYGTINSCGCFLGSAAKKAGMDVGVFCEEFGIEKDGNSPAEKWFMAVSVGHTPENNYAAKKGVEWIEEVLLKKMSQ